MHPAPRGTHDDHPILLVRAARPADQPAAVRPARAILVAPELATVGVATGPEPLGAARVAADPLGTARHPVDADALDPAGLAPDPLDAAIDDPFDAALDLPLDPAFVEPLDPALDATELAVAGPFDPDPVRPGSLERRPLDLAHPDDPQLATELVDVARLHAAHAQQHRQLPPAGFVVAPDAGFVVRPLDHPHRAHAGLDQPFEHAFDLAPRLP
ncbi:MAG: hypothetical protein ACE37K_22460 [Planctomycetota bacterium]